MRFRGRVQSFNDSSGTGTIRTKEYGDVYLHYMNCVPGEATKLSEGILVEFALVFVNEIYPVAKMVQIVDPPKEGVPGKEILL